MTGWFVSVNGPDNSGKTTQLRALANSWEGYQALGSIHHHDPAPWAAASGEDYATWWFTTSTTPTLTRMLLAGHTARARARRPGRVGLLDRGWAMLIAVAVATCAVKDDLDLDTAMTRIRAISAETASPQQEISILLLPSSDTEQSLRIAQQRQQHRWTGIYPDYQRHLHQALLRLAADGAFTDVIDTTESSIEQVQHRVCTVLADYRPDPAANNPTRGVRP